MMCGHCEDRVKGALEELPFVRTAEVSHKKGTARVALCGEPDIDALRNAVKKQGYKVISVK